MAKKLYEESNIQNIAEAIRAKNGTNNTYKVSEMAGAISAIESGGAGGNDETANYLVSDRSGLTNYTFPEGITKIEGYAFNGCSNLALTELPNTITSIGNNAFASCTVLAISTLPDGLTEISTSAFSMCKGITEMTIPANVQYVWTSAFSFCTNLASVTFMGTPEEIAENAFNYCNNLTTINVPWQEGEVAGAPWGATKATINYGYTPPITFTVDGVQYQAEANTNWYNWCRTEYNTNDKFFTYNDGYYRVADDEQEGDPDVYYNGERLIANSIIIEGGVYTTGG